MEETRRRLAQLLPGSASAEAPLFAFVKESSRAAAAKQSAEARGQVRGWGLQRSLLPHWAGGCIGPCMLDEACRAC